MRASIGVLLLSLATVPNAAAQEVSGKFSTLLSTREVVRDSDIERSIPLYELATLQLEGVDLPGFHGSSVVMQGWGRLQPGEYGLESTEADLNLLYADLGRRKLGLRVGRQHIFSGLGRAPLVDGARAHLDVTATLALEAWGGWTVYRQLRHQPDDRQFGTRAAVDLTRLDALGEIGVSYLQRRRDGQLVRHELGGDAFVVTGPVQWVGLAVLQPEAQRLVEARAAAVIRAPDDLVVTAEALRTAPELFLPMDSLFSVFSDAGHDALGADAQWDPSPFYRWRARGRMILRDGEYDGYRATLGATTFREPSHQSLVGLELTRLSEPSQGFALLRSYASIRPVERFRFGADLHLYRFDETFRGVRGSYLGQLSTVYDLDPAMRLAATVSGGATPFEEGRVEAMLRFAYGFNVDIRGDERP